MNYLISKKHKTTCSSGALEQRNAKKGGLIFGKPLARGDMVTSPPKNGIVDVKKFEFSRSRQSCQP